MPAIMLVLIDKSEERECILTNIPPELVEDVRAGLSLGGMDSQPFPLRLEGVARVLREHFEAPAGKDQGDAIL